MGKVIAVCISEKKGTQKKEVEEVRLVEDWGSSRMRMPENGIGR